LRSQEIDSLSTKKGIVGNRWQPTATVSQRMVRRGSIAHAAAGDTVDKMPGGSSVQRKVWGRDR
jgi:hypothetical protein